MNLINAFINTNGDKSKVLTPDEEVELTNKYYLTKDVNIRNEIAAHNLRLVIKIANEYSKNQELFCEGCIGLINGIERFDPTRGLKLSTYVSYWIRAYILNFIVNDAKLVKIGTTQSQRKLFFNLSKERASMEAQGLEVTSEALAERLVVSEKDLKEMEVRMTIDSSLDEPIRGSDPTPTGKSSKLDMLISDDLVPDEALSSFEKEEILTKEFGIFRGSLAPNEKVVFESRMLGEETLQEVGDKLNVSRERVRQLETRITERLQRFADAKSLSKLI